MTRFRRSAVGAVAVALALFAGSSASALAADTLTVTIPSATPVRGIPTTLTFSGADTPYNQQGATPFLYAVVRPVNGVPCQPTYGADVKVSGTTGVTYIYNANNNEHTVSSGSYSYSSSLTPVAGAYLVCAWLETDRYDDSSRGDTASVVTATAMTSYTTQNSDTIGISLPTTTPAPGVPITVSISGQDTPINANGGTAYLYALARPVNGVPCQATYGADVKVSGTTGVTYLYNANNNEHTVSSGSYSYSSSLTPVVGAYIVCAWLETDHYDDSTRGDTADVVTASTSVGYTVTAPVQCVVPKYAGKTLAKIKRQLVSAHCGVGRVRKVHRRHTTRGHVIGLSARPGTRHRAGFRVAITVSRGR